MTDEIKLSRDLQEPEYIGPAHFGGGNFGRDTLLRRVNDKGEEQGDYLVVTSTSYGGLWDDNHVEQVNTRVVSTKIDVVLTDQSVALKPGEMVKRVGKFILPEDTPTT